MTMPGWMTGLVLAMLASGAAAVGPQAPAMAARSLLGEGDRARIWRVMDKARRGQPITVAAIGGSIAQGSEGEPSGTALRRPRG